MRISIFAFSYNWRMMLKKYLYWKDVFLGSFQILQLPYKQSNNSWSIINIFHVTDAGLTVNLYCESERKCLQKTVVEKSNLAFIIFRSQYVPMILILSNYYILHLWLQYGFYIFCSMQIFSTNSKNENIYFRVN